MLPKRPNKFIYYTIGGLLKLVAFFKGQKYHQKLKIKGPAITLSNHTSWYDFAYTFAAIWPTRTTFLAAEKMFKEKSMRFWLNLSRAVPKKLFRADPQSVLATFKLLKQNEIVSIFPEGQIATTGRPIPISFAIAKLVKKAKVDVYGIVHENACLVDPPWCKKSFSGKTYTTMEKILTKDEIDESSEQEIYQRIVDKLAVNSDEINAIEKLKFKGKNIKGLNNILYRCEHCGHEGLITKKNQLICPNCSDTKTYDYYGLLSGRTIHEVYYKQKQNLIDELSKDANYGIASEAVLMSYEDNSIEPLGNGTFKLSINGYSYQGTYKGKPLKMEIPVDEVPALVGDLGRNIQIYYKDEYYQFELPIHYLTTKYILLSEILYEKITGHQSTGIF